jgi:hypothetical protein
MEPRMREASSGWRRRRLIGKKVRRTPVLFGDSFFSANPFPRLAIRQALT